MRRMLALFLTATLALPVATHAATGFCKVTQMSDVVASYDLAFGIDASMVPDFPVAFDEAKGTFSMTRDAFAAALPSGISFFTVGDVRGYLSMDPGTVTGTIDRAGNVVLPGFANRFGTDFCAPRPDYPVSPTLSTLPQSYVLQRTGYTSQGVPLNPTTGELTLEGFDVIPEACGAPGPLLNGIRMVCKLTPIPNLAAAPAAPALLKTSGKAAIGKPLPTTAPTKPDKGDVLTLKATLVPGGATFDFTSGDAYLELRSGTTRLVVLRIPAGKLVKKGKGFRVVDKPAKVKGGTASDPDGTVIEVQPGQKKNDTVEAATGGTISFTPGKNGIALVANVQGLDLSGVTGTIQVMVLAGHYEAAANVTVRGAGKKRAFK